MYGWWEVRKLKGEKRDRERRSFRCVVCLERIFLKISTYFHEDFLGSKDFLLQCTVYLLRRFFVSVSWRLSSAFLLYMRSSSNILPSGGKSSFPIFVSFFAFILRFWNQILICLSVKLSVWAISIRLLRVRYRLKWNSFSNSKVWYRVYVCLVLFGPCPPSGMCKKVCKKGK